MMRKTAGRSGLRGENIRALMTGASMGEVIRRGTIADVAAITALTRSAYAKWVPLTGREPLPMTADYSVAIIEHRFDLLFVDCDLAALIETMLREGDLLIENVAVAPEFQKRGLSRTLIAHAEQVATQAGRAYVRLYTNSRFEENLRLYASLGYAVEREEALNGGIAIHMVKQVA
jgi:ribosomal protein S18 acetylase RimI-like enzyme